MKKKFLIALLFLGSFAYSQQVQDLTLYGLEQRTGTPRFQAMAGAFGALGGDFSALGINPAGGAVFLHSQMGFSVSHYSTENQASFNGETHSANKRHLGFNQAGIVFVYKNQSDSPWKRISLALNSDNSNQYKARVNANGLTNTGVDQYFLDYANGIPFGDILKLEGELLEDAYLNIGSEIGFAAQQAFLGYYGGVLDPSELDNNSVSSYISNANYNQARQSNQIHTKGKNSKFIATGAAQYKDFLYLGVGLEFQSLLFEKQTDTQESGYAQNSAIQYVNFNNFIQTSGNGMAVSLGAIAKVGNALRLGLSYKSPTWYTLMDKTHQQIGSNLEDQDIGFIDQNIINIFEEYHITIPSKVTGSAAIVLGKKGLISVDYSQQDFSKARFRPLSDAYFTLLNNEAAAALTVVNSLNIGAEYNLGRLVLRAGYATRNSPNLNIDTQTTNKAFGLGWIFRGSRIDFALNQWDTTQNTYALDFQGAPPITISSTRNTATLGYTLFF